MCSVRTCNLEAWHKSRRHRDRVAVIVKRFLAFLTENKQSKKRVKFGCLLKSESSEYETPELLVTLKYCEGDSEFADELVDFQLPSAVDKPTVTGVSFNSVDLQWRPPQEGACECVRTYVRTVL